jgi:hypothetical protein
MMFIQVILGTCSRHDDLRALTDSWRDELAAGATGWLGGTYGFTDDDRFVAVVRFESRDAAQANADRPEQDAWAARMAGVLDGPAEFHDCEDVSLLHDGGSDDAGYVQVIRGRADDPAPVKALLSHGDALREMRPEILGGTLALTDAGEFFQTVYFSDEASARRGEGLEPPPEIRAQLSAAMAGATFYDLHEPWFETA